MEGSHEGRNRARNTDPVECAETPADLEPPCQLVGATEFSPSRKRDARLLMYMAASGKQPSGKSTPALFPASVVSMWDHVSVARLLTPPRQLLAAAVPPAGWMLGKRSVRDPTALIADRDANLQGLRDLSERLAPRNQRWVAKLASDRPSRGLNFAMIHFLPHHLGVC